MKVLRLVPIGTAMLITSSCIDTSEALGPAGPAIHSSELAMSPARRIETSGHFDAIVDFSTLTLTPRGRNCLLEVEGRLVFTGTIEGTAAGQTSALVFAPCNDVATTPPGTYPDVFRSEAVFEGTVDGQPAEANLFYMGRVQPGGRIEGRLILSNGIAGRLEVDAQVAVGGEYDGSVVIK